MAEGTITRYFRVDRRELVYLKFILEAYEGLATMSTANQKESIVKISYLEWSAEDIEDLIDSLSHEIVLKETDNPVEVLSA